VLAAQGQRVMKDGKPLESTEANLAELHMIANDFAEKQLPILKAVQIT
jgi:hypothetical protein